MVDFGIDCARFGAILAPISTAGPIKILRDPISRWPFRRQKTRSGQKSHKFLGDLWDDLEPIGGVSDAF